MLVQSCRYLLTIELVLASPYVRTTLTYLTSEHCSWETLTVQCPVGQVILIQSAYYGRMAAKRCISGNYAESMGCSADVSYYLDEHCSGRLNCSMLVATIDSLKQPCPKDFKPYLEINYECAKVSFLDDCRQGNATHLYGDTGYLALYRTPSGNGGSPPQHRRPDHCPWVLTVDAGKRLVLTWKLTRRRRPAQTARDDTPAVKNDVDIGVHRSSSSSLCSVTLSFRDIGDEVLTNGPCLTDATEEDGGGGFDTVYISRSSRLEIHLVLQSDPSGDPPPGPRTQDTADLLQLTHHIIQYRAFGCANIVAPDGTTVSRDGDDATISCLESHEKWFVRCQDGDWIGMVDNCTRKVAAPSPPRLSTTQHSYDDLRHGIVVAVSIGIVLGVVVGAVMMMVIFVVKKSRRNFGDRQMASPASSGLYELRASKAFRCPALYVPEVPISDIGLPSLYEYTYACRTVCTADGVSPLLELDKGTGPLTVATCTPCPVRYGEMVDEDDDDEGGTERIVPVGIYELSRQRIAEIESTVSQEKDLICTCKHNTTLLSRIGVESHRTGGSSPYVIQQLPS